MKKILFAYSTNEGQTYKILQKIQQHLGDVVEIEYYNLKDENIVVDLTRYSYALVASSIRYGKYSKEFYDFINQHVEELTNMNADFMSVNLTARKPGKDIPETSGYIRNFRKKSNWTPKKIIMFAGLLDYPRYRLIDKRMIQFIMWLTKGETNTLKTVEYTDWHKVEKFANQLKERLK